MFFPLMRIPSIFVLYRVALSRTLHRLRFISCMSHVYDIFLPAFRDFYSLVSSYLFLISERSPSTLSFSFCRYSWLSRLTGTHGPSFLFGPLFPRCSTVKAMLGFGGWKRTNNVTELYDIAFAPLSSASVQLIAKYDIHRL